MRIVVADDEPQVRTLLVRTLRHLGHDVVGEACDGDELIAEVAARKPDLVTLDLDMPGPNNESLAKRLCNVHRVAVVVVSGRAELQLATDLADKGIGAVVRKPFSLQDLAIAVEVAAARFQDLRDLRRQTDEAQRERVRLLQLFAASADGIYIARADGTMSLINDAALRLLGITGEGSAGRRIGDWPQHFLPRTADGKRLAADDLPLQRALRGEVVQGAELWID